MEDDKRKKVLIDLDDTLIDAEAQKAALFDALGPMIPQSTVEHFYQQIREGGGMDYDHLSNCFVPYGLDPGYVDTRVNALYDRTKEFEINGRMEWLEEKFPHDEYQWILFTLGDPEVQHRKVISLGLKDKFDEGIIVENAKAENLKKWVKPDEAFDIVDDRTKFLEQVRREFINANAYQATNDATRNPEIFLTEEELAEQGRREGGIK